jgi:hypothetical protein
MTEIQADDLIIAASPAGSDAPRKSVWHRFEPTILGTGTIVFLLLVWQFLPDFVPMKSGTKLFFTVPSLISGTLWDMLRFDLKPLGVSATGLASDAMAMVMACRSACLLSRSATLNAISIRSSPPSTTPRLVFLPL